MSSDGSSQLEGLWDAAVAGVINAYTAWGWVVPATLLTMLFCAVVVLLCRFLEDLPLDAEVVRTPVAIFRWTRTRWRETQWSNGKGTPDLVCLSLKADG